MPRSLRRSLRALKRSVVAASECRSVDSTVDLPVYSAQLLRESGAPDPPGLVTLVRALSSCFLVIPTLSQNQTKSVYGNVSNVVSQRVKALALLTASAIRVFKECCGARNTPVLFPVVSWDPIF